MKKHLVSPNRIRLLGVAAVLAAAASLPVASASADTSSTALPAAAQASTAVALHFVPFVMDPRMAK